MSYQKIILRLAAVISIVAMLTGCSTATTAPTTVPNPQATSGQVSATATVPTVDQQATLNAVGTQVAGTLIAGLTQNAPTETPVPPTATPVPATNTPQFTATPSLTNTPLATNTPVPPTKAPTATFIPWTATPSRTATLSTYNCSITSVSPAATATQKVGSDFDGNWVVKNTGSLAWVHTDVDIKYLSGTKFQPASESLMDMKTDVASGASFTVIVDMVAPADPGTYYASWGLVQGGLVICNMNLTVVVVK
jgi:hypothetical protein